MPDILRTSVTDASAWRPADFPNPDAWILTLTAGQVTEVETALATIKAKGVDGPGFSRGFQVIRGLTPDRYALDDLKMMLWGLGQYLGTGIIQNKQGELIGSVMDHGEAAKGTDPYLSGVRFYRTSLDLPPHTDSCDVVGLMCVRRAKTGGESSVVSATAMYN